MTQARTDGPRTSTARPARSGADVVVPLSGPLALVSMITAGALYAPSAVGANPTQAGGTLLGRFAEGVDRAPSSAGLYLVAAFALLVFAAVLWDRLRPDGHSQWPAALAAAGALTAALWLLDFARDTLAAIVAVEARDEVTVSVLISSGWESARLVMPAAAAMMLGAAVAGLRGALPRWFAWLSLVGAIGALGTMVMTVLPTSVMAGAPAGMLAMLSLAWTVPAGAVLAWTADRRTARTPDRGAAGTGPAR